MFKPIKITDVRDLEEWMYVRWTTHMDNHPMKSSARWFMVRHNQLYKNNGIDGLILGYEVDQMDNYSKSKHLSLTSVTNGWLFSEDYRVDVFDCEYHTSPLSIFVAEENLLSIFVNKLALAGAFYDSNFFKFDIDGYEKTDSDFRFSDLKDKFNRVNVDFHLNGEGYISQSYIHRPLPLKIAKFSTPRVLVLATGEPVVVTHISELGELIYDINGLKCVDKKLLGYHYTNSLNDNHRMPMMADALEESIIGDHPQYRDEFSFAVAKRYSTR